jgi:hypothetical protein
VAAEFRTDLLLDGGKVGVQVDEEPVEVRAGVGVRIRPGRGRGRLGCGNLAVGGPLFLMPR